MRERPAGRSFVFKGAPVTFKRCTSCGYAWESRDAFLGDPEIELIGFQVDAVKPEEGLFLFNHVDATCGSTLAIRAREFLDLHQGSMFGEKMAGTDRCVGHCLHADDLHPCPARCECAYVRAVLPVIREWPKRKG